MRIQRGLSQFELAQKLGYKGRDSISKIEVGKAIIPVGKLNDIAKALDCSIRYLLCEIDKPYHYESSVIAEYPESVSTIIRLAGQLTEEKRQAIINVMENMI